MKTQHTSRLLTTFVLAAAITLALGIATSSASAASKGRAGSMTSVSRPGVTAFSGEPDSGQGQLPVPKISPTMSRPGAGSSLPLRTWLWFGIWNLYLRR